MKNTEFTMEDALKIQQECVLEWKTVLNSKSYAALKKEVSKQNAKGYKSPYHVFRGSSISNFIENLKINNK